jgi:methylase of polypeptide subunit release factors
MDAKSLALTALGQVLRAKGYRFVAITPETHGRVVNRKVQTTALESVFGWNLPFDQQALDPELFALLVKAEALEIQEGRLKSSVRFATIADLLFVHSSFPTAERDAVFFGPDTYRFIRALRAPLAGVTASGPRPLRLIDIGCGTGAGGIFAARFLAAPPELILADINWKALAFSAINAVLNDFPSAKTVFSDVLGGIEGDADIIIANPPYLVDEDQRLYRDGGGPLGISLAVRIAEQSLARLKRGGRLVLYSGAPIVGGADPFFESLRPHLQLYGCQYSYEEIDPDVFGEELDKGAYVTADRIAAVVLVAIKG